MENVKKYSKPCRIIFSAQVDIKGNRNEHKPSAKVTTVIKTKEEQNMQSAPIVAVIL